MKVSNGSGFYTSSNAKSGLNQRKWCNHLWLKAWLIGPLYIFQNTSAQLKRAFQRPCGKRLQSLQRPRGRGQLLHGLRQGVHETTTSGADLTGHHGHITEGSCMPELHVPSSHGHDYR